jgi:D-alanine transaminase
MIVYLNGQAIPKDEARVSPDDRGFTFADGAYEVVRAYGGRFFKAQEHLARLERSLQELRIAAPDTQSLGEVAAQLLQHNRLQDGDALLYIQVTRGVATRRHSFPDPAPPPTVYASAFPFAQSREKWQGGIKAILVPDIRWARCDIKSVALLPNVLASQHAREQGAAEAVFVRDGIVTEGAHTNFLAVLGRQLVTHPRTNCILAGVTRQAVLDLCHALDIPVSEMPVHERQLKEASELMITSTTSEVTPVVQIDDWQVADGQPGPITTRLQRAFRDLVSTETTDAARLA